MNLSVGNFLLAVLAYFLFDALISAVVTKPDAQRVFHIILLIGCVCFALFGQFLPFHL